ncbi:ABC transporter permease [Streptomyces armeniacus]|nr:ABC transporter permease [Streptomyces armeniacus]
MSPGRALVAVLVLVPLIVSFALWAFVWPAARTAPREVPIGLAGPAAATAPVQDKLTRAGDSFDVHRYSDEAQARDAIEQRDVYGAIVVTPDGPKALTASAASPLVAQLLQTTVTQMAGGSAQSDAPPVSDVVATPQGDPRGTAFSTSALPLAIGGVAAGTLIFMLGLRGTRALVALVSAAALIGLVATTLTHSWLEVLGGNWWAEAGALSLSALALSSIVAGMAMFMGTAGIGIGALLAVMLGNPFSGVTSAPQMLPEPFGAIGQWLPPGAGGSLLRSVSFFDGNAMTQPALILSGWALAGLTLVAVNGWRNRTGAHSSSTSPEYVPASAA